jgi:hypothetical protein
MRLPLAARGADFAMELQQIGVDVPADPTLVEVIVGVTEAIDRRLPNNRGRTDIGELAQMSAAETLSEYVGGRLQGLFETTLEDVRDEFARLATAKEFGLFARDFFARFVGKTLESYVCRTLPDQLGGNNRFRTLGQARQFREALDLHCRETAMILGEFAGDWLSKHNYETRGHIDRDLAARFVSYASTKLISELRRRNSADGP